MSLGYVKRGYTSTHHKHFFLAEKAYEVLDRTEAEKTNLRG